MNGQLVFTEKRNCQDCYRCIKFCPVKAVKVESHSASVIGTKCINCGMCVTVCQMQAKKVRDDTDILKEFFRKGEKVICSLAPSFVSEFPGVDSTKLISALKKLGFIAVSETALGAEIISERTMSWLAEQKNGVYLSACCPSVVRLTCIYFPDLKDNLIPVVSPMIAHGKYIKKLYGDNVKIVFVGPCIAKKNESDENNDIINAAITFKDLKNLFRENNIDPKTGPTLNKENFIPHNSAHGRIFPLEGGMTTNMKKDTVYPDISFMSISGSEKIISVLKSLKDYSPNHKIVLELMTCSGGCTNGPGTENRESDLKKRFDILKYDESSDESAGTRVLENDELTARFYSPCPSIKCLHTEDEILNAFESVGKFTSADELNCGGCGYENCREFATAMLDGKAERAMCISYMRKVAQDKASVLLKKIPAGVVIADDELKILDSNERFANMMGENTNFVYKSKSGLEGAHLPRIISFSKLFEKVLETGEDIIEKDIRFDNKYYEVSVVAIQRYKIVCGIIKDMREKDIQRQMVVERTQEVIKENMLSVQKIARLLGENASYTESMLNSILDSYDEQ
ncbi:MAG: [Fe-Fe] hydrogenase large subunit C-terminal domain-containing protein [Ignavibacteria bacterium]|nr:[Fe-Fe] hydrogenase large subunit C-terminal domain-containing protein [Ignavibacteria bacterium]